MKTNSLLSLLVLGASMSVGAAAHATDCTSDADCARGEVCSYTDAAMPCIPEDPTCGTATSGICTPVSISGDCATDADCPDGLACAEVGGSACSSPACPPGEPCPEPTPCEPTIFYGCVAPPPPPCNADSDCSEGLTCIIESYEVCSGGGFGGGPEPLPGDPSPGTPDGSGTGSEPVVDCTTETYSYCAPRWMGPCTTAADCGDGFTCEPELSCYCSGSGGTDVPPDTGTGSSDPGSSGSSSGSDGGAPTPGSDSAGSGSSLPAPDGSGATEDPCACEPTGSNYCALPDEPTACTAASDCPTDWSCEELPSGDTTCAVSPDGTTDCPEATVAFYCLPPNWREAISASDAGAAYTGSRNDALGGGAESSTSPLDNLPGGALDAAASGAPTPQATVKKASDSGCSAVGSSAGLGSMLLALVGLVALRRRRIHG